MFKSARWRSEKSKIKAVFKLQFHATQLKQLAGDSLIISIIPADIGKPTTRLEKSKVKDGSCYWEKPHYETAKFVHDPKNGKFHEKIYHFVLSMGSSKSSNIGEVSIDFASFSEATKISSLCLPLKNANCVAFLHVSIQKVQDSLDRREIDGSEDTNHQDRSLRAQLSNGDLKENIKINPDDDHAILSDNINRDNRGSNGSDITLSGSDTSSEPDPNKTKPTREQSSTTIYEEGHVSHWDWLDGSPPELTTDDSSVSPGEPVLGEIPENGSPESMIKILKSEIEVLGRQVDVSELELQTLRKQIVKERKKGQDLSREIDVINEEKNVFKEECEKLKEHIKCTEETKVKVKVKGDEDPWDLVDELRQELNYERDLNSNLRLQLQKTQESNGELILAVQDLDAMLEQKDSEKSKSKSRSRSRSRSKSESETDDDEDQKALEDIVRQHSGTQDTYLLEQKITDLYSEIESYKRDKNELEMQMDQIALDYEILKQGNHDMCYKLEQSQLQEQLKIQYECSSFSIVNELEAQIESLNNELKMKSDKLSESVLEIQELQTIIKNLEKDLDDQEQGFELDIEELINAKVEQEKKVIIAEENVRKIKMQNAKTAEKLQEEFTRLSTQMSSSFEANEKVTIKAINEANQIRLEKRYLEEMLKKVKQDLDHLSVCYEEKSVDLLSQISQKSKELEKMEKQMEDINHKFELQKTSYEDEIERLKVDKQNLEDERKNLENIIKQKDSDYEQLQSEIEQLKSRYNEMKISLTDDETKNEKMRKEISRLKDEIKNREDTLISMENKLKDTSIEYVSRNRIELLEGELKLKETALTSSENSFLEKEKYLQDKIKDLEKRLEILDETTATTQASATNEREILKKLNKSMEVELMEMQERYSEISLKFAEVEGERQQLVMRLRTLKNRRNASDK